MTSEGVNKGPNTSKKPQNIFPRKIMSNRLVSVLGPKTSGQGQIEGAKTDLGRARGNLSETKMTPHVKKMTNVQAFSKALG